MKVTEYMFSDKMREDRDYRNFLQINLDGTKLLRFLDGEPEDANLSRDFIDCFNIAYAMKLAYGAGKRGEEWIEEYIQINSWEDMKK